MFSELPKLFDRNFAIGFFLPMALFLIAASSVLADVPWVSARLALGANDLVTGVTAATVVTWSLSISLVALNYVLIRFLEGYYWPLDRWNFLSQRQVDRWKAMSSEIKEIEGRWHSYQKEDKKIPLQLMEKRNQLMRRRVNEFPDEEGLILPTGFGNVIRAFEVYPRIIYGIDSIPGWIRLLGVIPKDFQNYIESAKARLDLCVNVFYLSLLLGLVCAIRLGFTFNMWAAVLFAVSIVMIASMYWAAKGAAMQWGVLIKAAFDLHLQDLAAKLGHKLPQAEDARHAFWRQLSQSMLYHLPFHPVPQRAPASKKRRRTGGKESKKIASQ